MLYNWIPFIKRDKIDKILSNLLKKKRGEEGKHFTIKKEIDANALFKG